MSPTCDSSLGFLGNLEELGEDVVGRRGPVDEEEVLVFEATIHKPGRCVVLNSFNNALCDLLWIYQFFSVQYFNFKKNVDLLESSITLNLLASFITLNLLASLITLNLVIVHHTEPIGIVHHTEPFGIVHYTEPFGFVPSHSTILNRSSHRAFWNLSLHCPF